MNSNHWIIHACTIESTGQGIPISNEEVSASIANNTLAWVHLDANQPECRQWLESEVTYLDSIIIDALLAEETRPRIVEFEDGALLILRGVNLNKDAEPEDMISIRLWVDNHRIISIERRKLKAVKDIHGRLLSNKGPKSSGEFVATLVGCLFERMEPVFSALDEQLDNVEEAVIETPDKSERAKITLIRKQAIMFRRYIAPQRDVITYLRTSEQVWLEQTHKRRLQEALDRVIRYIEDLDTIRERAQIVKDELANALSDKMNKNLYMLSVVSAIFLPLGFLTGLLGINLGGIPGADSGNAFYIFCLVMTSVIAIQIAIFKKLKWF